MNLSKQSREEAFLFRGLYDDSYLTLLLYRAGVAVPNDPPRDQLIDVRLCIRIDSNDLFRMFQLAQKHLNGTLGKPRRMARLEVPEDLLTEEDQSIDED